MQTKQKISQNTLHCVHSAATGEIVEGQAISE